MDVRIEGPAPDNSKDRTTEILSYVYLLIAAIFWGGTNPFLRKGARVEPQENISPDFFQNGRNFHRRCLIRFHNAVSKAVSLMMNWQISIPFAVNQFGSLFFYLGLANSKLSVAVPLTNSLTLFFTTCTGVLLGETLQGRHILGMLAVITGIFICAKDM